MDEAVHCPECGRGLAGDAPLGLCPGCLMKMALTQPSADQVATTDGGPDVPIPEPGSESSRDLPNESPPAWAVARNDRIPPWSGAHAGSNTSTYDAAEPVADETATYAARCDPDPAPPGPPSGDGHAPPGYEILEELGRGGMGVVYRARQAGLGRLVALKMIQGEAQARPAQLERFRIEAEAVARLRHPNVVQIFEVGDAAGRPYFSRELL
jgi:hypothetical protein